MIAKNHSKQALYMFSSRIEYIIFEFLDASLFTYIETGSYGIEDESITPY